MNKIKRKNIAKQAAKAAGKAILTVNLTTEVQKKEGWANFVTAGDLASEKIIVRKIKTYYPNDLILSEETKFENKNILELEHLWVIDPIDGTHNFKHERNYSAISIAYVEKGITKIAAIYDPFRNELFFAEQNKGAYVNNKMIHVSHTKDIHKATVATDNAYDPSETRINLALIEKLEPLPWILIKSSGVLTMCEVACGRIDLYFHTTLKPWDNAAAMLIIKEAGGETKNLKGEKITFLSSTVVAGNKELIKQFISETKP